MAQLKMYWLPGTKIESFDLPDGYAISNYQTEEDKLAWCECCRNGLIADDAGVEAFDRAILGRKDVCPERDVFFLDHAGQHIGTVTAYVHRDENIGDMHMVAIRTDHRGRGLAKYLNMITLEHLKDTGIRYIALTTDEWRKGAIKSYVRGGFCPVEYDTGMEDRWLKVMRDLGIAKLQMLDNDGNPYKLLAI